MNLVQYPLTFDNFYKFHYSLSDQYQRIAPNSKYIVVQTSDVPFKRGMFDDLYSARRRFISKWPHMVISISQIFLLLPKYLMLLQPSLSSPCTMYMKTSRPNTKIMLEQHFLNKELAGRSYLLASLLNSF